MSRPLIDRLFRGRRRPWSSALKVRDASRFVSGALAYLCGMDTERLSGLGLEPVLTTSELAEYLSMHAQAHP
jgi:hypothetical protein